MKSSRKQKVKNITFRWLKSKLRHLREVEIPETLVGRLLAGIPDSESKTSAKDQVKWYPKNWSLGAAAAVLVFVSVFMVSYGLFVPSGPALTEFNDIASGYAGGDQTNLLSDQNTTSIKRSLSYEANWPVISHNEPGF